MAVRSVTLLLIKDHKSENEPGAGWMIRVAQWIGDKGASVLLEKRSYFNKGGQQCWSKAQGLGLKDLVTIHPHWKEIVRLQKNPPKVEPLDRAKPQQEEIEEVPF